MTRLAGIEQLRQPAPGAIEKHPDTHRPKAKRPGNLAVVGAFDISEPQKLALLRTQLRERARHVDAQRQVESRHRGLWRARIVRASFEPLPAPVVDHQVTRDAKQERSQLLLVFGRRWRTQDA